jgi:polar amino acid transport system substrate-binding protein
MKLIILLTIFSFNISANTKIIVAAEDDASPWSNKDGSGFANKLVIDAFKSQKIDVELLVLPYAQCKNHLKKKLVSACFTMSKDKETESFALFPKNYLIKPENVIISKNVASGPVKKCSCGLFQKGSLVLTTIGYEYSSPFSNMTSPDKGCLKNNPIRSEILVLKMIEFDREKYAVVTIDEMKTLSYLRKGANVSNKVGVLCSMGSEPGYLAFNREDPNAPALIEKFDQGISFIKKRKTN